ncbi:EF-hand domain-containing protein [Cavenderia fasciculata]|uniref:EF-hand domain-containing protein n=1 Tax=Cavenderia fasciculata TaxID=261658 RepID=F4Q7T9_CACFS|nr:EF-hand domain-containing protein [Cavenderia fasciculata]EGG15839.1 EF-hand domain-containing protein [Cavenderia fasciculata]|eukprot:XP_004352164.1 EF-hand domain-containing protein [Cavenderia fasciculata]
MSHKQNPLNEQSYQYEQGTSPEIRKLNGIMDAVSRQYCFMNMLEITLYNMIECLYRKYNNKIMAPPSSPPSIDDRTFITNLFKSLDINGDGKLTKQEIKDGFFKLKIPSTDASIDQFLQFADENHDGQVTLPEFTHYIERNLISLKKIFNELDTDKSGTLDFQEIEQSINKLGLKLYSDQELVRLFHRIDSNKDNRIDFNEWRELLVLLPSSNLSALVAFWKDSQILDGGGDGGGFIPPPITVVAEAAKNLSATGSVMDSIRATMTYMGAGAIAGVVSRTATAPIERVKITCQINHGSNKSIPEVFRQVFADGGFRGMFRGNLANVLKVSPESAIKFGSFEAIKRLFAESDSELTSQQRFISGASAGVISHTSLFPLEVVRTRLSAAHTGAYSGIVDCFKQTYQTGGLRVFYRGLGASIFSTIPHAGINMTVYEGLKHEIIKRTGTAYPSSTALLACASVSSVCGQMVGYPFHVIKTRIVTQGTPINPEIYSGLFDGLSKTVKKEGFKGLYRGIIPNFMKSIPSHAITFGVYEQLKQTFNISKKSKH